ncbi:MAG: HD domain-containing protein [Patescibacteria group bacterium]|nr:HD domain-containing protein [Patescibacteria group bacterium]
MSKKLYIKDLKVGDSIFGEIFAVKSFTRKASRNNKPYIDIELADNSGTVRGKIWSDDIANCEEVEEGDVVEINATVEEYNGPQLNITNLKKIDKYEIGELQQKSQFDIEKMWADVKKTMDGIKNPHLKKLLDNVFDKETTELYKKAAAAYRVHHAYVGGLLEHSWEMLKMADGVKDHYPKINMDLVNTGIILHDIGKMEEYVITTTIGFIDRGKLLGHIYMGAEKVKENLPKDMPEDLAEEIIHIILSHHGEPGMGSPIRPMTTEALAVHVFDVASSKMNTAYNHIVGDYGTDKYTPYIPQLETELYRSPYLSEETNLDTPF